jgi:NADPH-dependent 2,4-dienoyl-CoA reductase/sulfur reductase-like enzyme
MRLVVIGHGMVGARFVEEVIAHDAAGKYAITVLGAEDCEPYNRVLLSDVVAGRTHEEALGLGVPVHDRLVVHRGTSATLLDREDRAVVTADGRRHRYDQLVLATGASARVPEIPGLRAQRGGTAPTSPSARIPCARSTTRARSSLPHGTPAAPSSSGPVCSASRWPLGWPHADARSPSCTRPRPSWNASWTRRPARS